MGMNEYATKVNREVMRRGSMSRGSRINNARNLDKHIVPNKTVKEWTMAACTICLEVGAGVAKR